MSKKLQNIIITVSSILLLFISEAIYETMMVLSVILIFLPIGMLGFVLYRLLIFMIKYNNDKKFKWLSKLIDVSEANLSCPFELDDCPYDIKEETIDEQVLVYLTKGRFKNREVEVSKYMICCVDREAEQMYSNHIGTYLKFNHNSDSINISKIEEFLAKSNKEFHIEFSENSIIILIDSLEYFTENEPTIVKKREFSKLFTILYELITN